MANSSKIRTIVLLILAISISQYGCKKDDPIIEAKDSISLNFNGFFGNEPLEFNTMKYITKANDTLNFTRISFLMSDFTLEKANGDLVKLSDTNALISLGINRNILKIEGKLPEGEFVKIHFTIGLDSATNHSDPSQYSLTHPLNPIVNQMHWDWAGGYIFMVSEGYYMNNGNSNSIFTYHMANLEYAKKISLSAPKPFNIKDVNQVEIKIDWANLYNTPNEYSIKNDGSTSHSTSAEDKVIMTKLRENLNTVFTITEIK